MAIARDTSTVMTKGAAGETTHNISHTVTGSNPLLVCGFMSTGTISSVTWNTTEVFTQITTVTPTGGQALYLYYLLNPTTGANTITITRVGTTDTIYAQSVSYTGVKQSSQPDSSNSNTSSSGTSLSVSTTTIADQSIAVAIGEAAAANFGTPTDGASTGSTAYSNPGAGAGNVNMWESTTFPITPAGNYSMAMASNTNQAMGIIIASFAPAAATGATTRPNNLLTLGVS